MGAVSWMVYSPMMISPDYIILPVKDWLAEPRNEDLRFWTSTQDMYVIVDDNIIN